MFAGKSLGFAAVACLFAFALAASESSSSESRHSFQSGHEYSYQYDGQIASSMSNGEQYSASRFRTLVKLNFVSNKNVMVQLENSQLGNWNEYLDTPQELHRFDKFDRVEIKSDHIEKLNLPFQFRYSNGKISDLQFHSDDISFSENAKRAIINALQVQLENPSASSESRRIDNDEEQQQQRDNESYGFRLNETTIEGECESLYSVRKFNTDESDAVDSYNVSKSIDFSQCRYRPELRYNYFRYAEPIEATRRNVDDKLSQKYIHSNPALDISSVYEFALAGDRRQFIVKESKVLSTYSYEMIDGKRVRLVTYAIAKLALKNVERKESADSMPSTKSAVSLVYSDSLDILKERFIAEGDETYLRLNPYMRMPNAPQVVSTIMKRLFESSTKMSVEGIEEHATRYLTQLVSILRLCSRKDIQEIHQTLFDSSEYNGSQKVFMQGILSDAMAIAGTKLTIDHLILKIKNGDITAAKASSALSKLMNLRVVSSETVRNLEQLCQESRVQDSTMLKRTCMLTYGALVNAMCKVESPFKHSDKYTTDVMTRYCDASTKEELSKNIIASYKKASSRADKVLALKTIGNMGLENTVSFLEEIIRDLNVEKIIRIQAIDALRQMRREMPRKIQRILLPVFQDRREHPEIRMNSIYQLLHSRPEKAILEMIMTEMIREPNMHVKSFVNQLVSQMIEGSQDFYDRETALNLRSMLKHFRLYSDEEKTPLFTSKFYSSVVAVDHSQFHELASQLNLATLFSNDSRLPKEVMATVNLLSNNRLIPNVYQVGVHTQDVEQLLERLFNAWDSKDFDEVVTRGRRSITEESFGFLKSLYNKMKIATRRVSSESATPMVLIYTRYQDMDTNFCLTDEESLPHLLKAFIVDGRIDVLPWEMKNVQFSWVSASYGYEQQIKTPTITGLPILTTIRVPTIVVVDGTISTNFSEKDNEEESRVRSARAHLKVEPRIATTVIVKMEVFSPFFTSGIKTFHSAQIRVPLNLISKVHAPQWIPEVELHMPVEEIRVLHLQSRPVTFFRVWPAKSGVFVEATEKTLIVQEAMAPLKESRWVSVDPFLGLTVKMDSHWHGTPTTEHVLGDWILSGENSYELRVQPTSDSNKVMKLTFKVQSKETSDVRDIKVPDFQHIFGTHTKQMLAHTQKDELRLIQEQMKRASTKLNRFIEIQIQAQAIKGSRPRVATLNLKTLCDDRMLLCIATNTIDVDSEWTFKADAQLAMPELRGVVAGFPSRHLIATVKADFGSTEKSQVMLNLYGRPSLQKIESTKRYMNNRAEKNIEYDAEDIFENAPQVLKPNDYVMIVDNKLSKKVNRNMQSLFDFLSYMSIVNMPDRELIEQEVSKPSQVLMARIVLDERQCNMTLSLPNQPQSFSMNWEDSETSQARGLFDVLRRSHDDRADAECSIKKGKFVKSFDGKTYKLPMTTCYTILAKDCTEEPQFAMMAKKLDKFGDELKLKMVTRTKTYELENVNKKMVVRVNNYIINQKDFEENGIYKVADHESLYEIRCKDTGASVRFDGINIIARIGNEYVNRQCGVCGHMNFDQSDDLRRADLEEASSLRDFHQSYLYRDTECDAEAVQAVQRDSSEEGRDEEYQHDITEDIEEDQENSSPILKTVTLQRHNKLCFSEKPIHQCEEGSRKIDPTKEEIKYICMNRTSHKAQRLLRTLRTKNTVELEDIDTDRNDEETESIQIPRACSSNAVRESRENSRRSQQWI